jgi:hypothetical protein
MKRSRFTEEQIHRAVRQMEGGRTAEAIKKLCQDFRLIGAAKDKGTPMGVWTLPVKPNRCIHLKHPITKWK